MASSNGNNRGALEPPTVPPSATSWRENNSAETPTTLEEQRQKQRQQQLLQEKEAEEKNLAMNAYATAQATPMPAATETTTAGSTQRTLLSGSHSLLNGDTNSPTVLPPRTSTSAPEGGGISSGGDRDIGGTEKTPLNAGIADRRLPAARVTAANISLTEGSTGPFLACTGDAASLQAGAPIEALVAAVEVDNDGGAGVSQERLKLGGGGFGRGVGEGAERKHLSVISAATSVATPHGGADDDRGSERFEGDASELPLQIPINSTEITGTAVATMTPEKHVNSSGRTRSRQAGSVDWSWGSDGGLR